MFLNEQRKTDVIRQHLPVVQYLQLLLSCLGLLYSLQNFARNMNNMAPLVFQISTFFWLASQPHSTLIPVTYTNVLPGRCNSESTRPHLQISLLTSYSLSFNNECTYFVGMWVSSVTLHRNDPHWSKLQTPMALPTGSPPLSCFLFFLSWMIK